MTTQFKSWWSEQTKKGDPNRNVNLVKDAFEGGMVADRWLPIETVPIGEQVLFAAEFDGSGNWRIKSGYRCAETNVFVVFGASWTPTRWMPLPEFKSATCKGCYAFGTACGRCEKCEIDPMNPKNMSSGFPEVSSDASILGARERKRDITLIEDMVEELRTAKNYCERSQEIRTAFNEAIDRLLVLVSKLNEGEKSIKQLTKQQCINYWQEDNITEEDINYFVKRIKENGFYRDVPLDAQAAMRSWAECEPSEKNGKYLKAFAEIARLALGVE